MEWWKNGAGRRRNSTGQAEDGGQSQGAGQKNCLSHAETAEAQMGKEKIHLLALDRIYRISGVHCEGGQAHRAPGVSGRMGLQFVEFG